MNSNDSLVVLAYSLVLFVIGYITRIAMEKHKIKKAYTEGRKDGYDQAIKRVMAYQEGKKEIVRVLKETRGIFN